MRCCATATQGKKRPGPRLRFVAARNSTFFGGEFITFSAARKEKDGGTMAFSHREKWPNLRETKIMKNMENTF
jgi:hypothetical protein